jgi:hypothetical protein
MSSGKPQTRGLAALLRIEKERRTREEAGAEESTAPSPEGGEEKRAPLEVVAPARGPETAAEPAGTRRDSGEEGAGAQAELPESSEEDGRATTVLETEAEATGPGPEATQNAAAPAEGDDVQRKAAVPFPVAHPSPRPRRSPTRPVAAPRGGAGAIADAPHVSDPGWERFAADWKPFLREGVKFKLCEFFYRNTVAVGRREFTTSTAQLSRVSGAHRRHIFLVLRQLEELRFIRKAGVETNRKDEGLVISFFPDRQG